MKVPSDGVPVGELIRVVKESVKRAGVSASSPDADLRVTSVGLTLRVLASKTAGGGVDFRVPFIGMKLSIGAKVTREDTHVIEITLVPPPRPAFQVRGDVEEALVDAITTIRAGVASAALGDDPWQLAAGTVDLSFAITRSGSITLGANGELSREVTNTLRLGLAPS